MRTLLKAEGKDMFLTLLPISGFAHLLSTEI